MADLINPVNLPPAFLGVPYECAIAYANATVATAHSISVGSLPAGLTLDAGVTSQRISGTPTAVGPVTFTFSVTDTSGTTTKQYTLTVYGSPNDAAELYALNSPAQRNLN